MQGHVSQHAAGLALARRNVSGLVSRSSQMMMQKMLKMQHIFAYNLLPWGLSPRDLQF